MKPFHLSFVVDDLALAKAFYVDLLNCPLGRDTGAWFDVLFFEHQITIHKANEKQLAYRINHFGPIVDKPVWQSLLETFRKAEVNFVLQPLVRQQGLGNESGKFMIEDYSGNILEFKYYANFEKTLELTS